MNYLSLYTGICGGDLAMQHLLGMRCIGYVEIDSYCQKVIAQRQKDGFLDTAPIFGDIRTFLDSGYAASYKGLVDLITAGFPCQPHSTAGKRKGAADERDMWPATAEVIGMVRPQFVFLENVPGIIQGQEPYVWRVISALSALGYDSRWCVLGARDVGAPHRRDRWWCLAHHHVDDADKGIGRRQDPTRWDIQARAENSGVELDNPAGTRWSAKGSTDAESSKGYGALQPIIRSGERTVADPECGDDGRRESEQRRRPQERTASEGTGQLVGHGLDEGLEGRSKSAGSTDEFSSWPPGPTERDKWAAVLIRWPELAPALSREEEVECDVRRGIDGGSNRMVRLKALGNAQVALCAATAFCILYQWRPPGGY